MVQHTSLERRSAPQRGVPTRPRIFFSRWPPMQLGSGERFARDPVARNDNWQKDLLYALSRDQCGAEPARTHGGTACCSPVAIPMASNPATPYRLRVPTGLGLLQISGRARSVLDCPPMYTSDSAPVGRVCNRHTYVQTCPRGCCVSAFRTKECTWPTICCAFRQPHLRSQRCRPRRPRPTPAT